MGAEQISFGPFILDRGTQTLLLGRQTRRHRPARLCAARCPRQRRRPGHEGRSHRSRVARHHRRGGQPHGPDRGAAQGARQRGRTGRNGSSPCRASATGWCKRQQATSPEPSTVPALAVLPFQNLSGDPEQDYFADGMVEDIITALSRFRTLCCRSPAVRPLPTRAEPSTCAEVARRAGGALCP